jgi:WD40 repeat protein
MPAMRAGHFLIPSVLSLIFTSASFEPALASDDMDAYGDPLPLGALARLGTIRMRQGNSAECVAFSPDGKILVTGEAEGVLRFWDLNTGQEAHTLRLPGNSIDELVFSPDGHSLAVIVGRYYPKKPSVFVCGAADAKVLHEFKDNSRGFRSLAFAGQGKRLTAMNSSIPTSEGKDVPAAMVWDVATGKELAVFSDARSFALAGDGTRAFVGHSDGSISINDVDTEKEIMAWKAHDGPVYALALSADGKELASAGEPREEKKDKANAKAVKSNSLILWDPATGANRCRCADFPGRVEHLVFSPDGQTLAALGPGRASTKDAFDALGDGPIAHLFATSTGKPLKLCEENLERSWNAFYSPDSKSVVLRHHTQGLVQIETATGKMIRRFGRESESGYVAFSPDGKWISAAGGAILLWDAKTGKERFPSPAHRDCVVSMVFSPDAKTLASLDSTHRLLLWDIAKAKVLHPEAEFAETRLFTYGFSKGGDLLTVIENNGRVRVWQVSTAKKLHEFQILFDKATSWIPKGARDILLSPDGDMLAVADDEYAIRLFDVPAGKEQSRLKGHRKRPVWFLFSPDGKTLTSYADDHTVRVWDIAAAKERACFRINEDRKGAFTYSADSRLLAWSGDDVLHLWSLAEEKEIGVLAADPHYSSALVFAGDSRTLATVEKDGTVRTWDLAGARELHAFKGKNDWDFNYPMLYARGSGPIIALGEVDPKGYRHELRVAATGRKLCALDGYEEFALSADGKHVASGTDWLIVRDSTTAEERVWLPPVHRGRRWAVAFSPDGKLLASGGEDSAIILWEMSGLRKSEPIQLYSLPHESLEKHWTDLALDGNPYNAAHYLQGDPKQAVPFLEDKLGRIGKEDAKRVRKWIGQLDDPQFDVRENAAAELSKLGKLAEPALRQALDGMPSSESRRRLEELLEKAKATSSLPLDCQRALKALEVLELIDSPVARQVLEELAKKKADFWLGREAKAALDRAAKRKGAPE